MFNIKDKNVFLRKSITIFLIVTFTLTSMPCIEEAQALSPWTGMQKITVRREMLNQAIELSKVLYAEEGDPLLENSNALLLSHGKILLSPELKGNSLKQLRTIFHEEIEAVMQILNKQNRSAYSRMMNLFLSDSNINSTYNLISRDYDKSKMTDELIFNDIIASAFELLLLLEDKAISEKEITPEEHKFINAISPVIMASKHNFFTGVFWDQYAREMHIRAAIANGQKFQQVESIKEKGDTSPERDEIIKRLILKTREEWDGVGGCKEHSLSLLRLLSQNGINGRIVASKYHYWVEIGEKVIDAFPEGNSNECVETARKLGDKRFLIINKGSDFAKKFYAGKVDIERTDQTIGDSKNDVGYYERRVALFSKIAKKQEGYLALRKDRTEDDLFVQATRMSLENNSTQLQAEQDKLKKARKEKSGSALIPLMLSVVGGSGMFTFATLTSSGAISLVIGLSITIGLTAIAGLATILYYLWRTSDEVLPKDFSEFVKQKLQDSSEEALEPENVFELYEGTERIKMLIVQKLEKEHKKPVTVLIKSLSGSGKSTVRRNLSQWLKGEGHKVEIVEARRTGPIQWEESVQSFRGLQEKHSTSDVILIEGVKKIPLDWENLDIYARVVVSNERIRRSHLKDRVKREIAWWHPIERFLEVSHNMNAKESPDPRKPDIVINNSIRGANRHLQFGYFDRSGSALIKYLTTFAGFGLVFLFILPNLEPDLIGLAKWAAAISGVIGSTMIASMLHQRRGISKKDLHKDANGIKTILIVENDAKGLEAVKKIVKKEYPNAIIYGANGLSAAKLLLAEKGRTIDVVLSTYHFYEPGQYYYLSEDERDEERATSLLSVMNKLHLNMPIIIHTGAGWWRTLKYKMRLERYFSNNSNIRFIRRANNLKKVVDKLKEIDLQVKQQSSSRAGYGYFKYLLDSNLDDGKEPGERKPIILTEKEKKALRSLIKLITRKRNHIFKAIEQSNWKKLRKHCQDLQKKIQEGLSMDESDTLYFIRKSIGMDPDIHLQSLELGRAKDGEERIRVDLPNALMGIKGLAELVALGDETILPMIAVESVSGGRTYDVFENIINLLTAVESAGKVTLIKLDEFHAERINTPYIVDLKVSISQGEEESLYFPGLSGGLDISHLWGEIEALISEHPEWSSLSAKELVKVLPEHILILYTSHQGKIAAAEQILYQIKITKEVFEGYLKENNLHWYSALKTVFTTRVKEALLEDPELRPIFMEVLPDENMGPIKMTAPLEFEGINVEELMNSHSVFLVGSPEVAEKLVREGRKIIVGVTDKASSGTLMPQNEVANGRQAYFPLSDGTWLGVKGSGQFNSDVDPPYWFRNQAGYPPRHEGIAWIEDAEAAQKAASKLQGAVTDFTQLLGYRLLLAVPDGEGGFKDISGLVDDYRKCSQPVLIFHRTSSVHRVMKIPQLLETDPGLRKMSKRISKTLSTTGYLPEGTTLTPSEMVTMMMGRFGRSEAVKQNLQIFKETIHSQDFNFAGEESDTEEFVDAEVFSKIFRKKFHTALAEGTIYGEANHAVFSMIDDSLSIFGIISKLDSLKDMLKISRDKLKYKEDNVLFLDSMKPLEALFRSYFSELEDKWLDVWDEPSAYGLSHPLMAMSHSEGLYAFHPDYMKAYEADDFSSFDREKSQNEIADMIRKWLKEEISERKEKAQNSKETASIIVKDVETYDTVTAPSLNAPRTALRQSIPILMDTAYNDYGARALRVPLEADEMEPGGGIILYADDILKSTAALDLETTIHKISGSGGVLAQGKVILYAKEEKANALVLEEMIKRASPEIETIIITGKELALRKNLDGSEKDEVEALVKFAKSKGASNLIGLIKGPTEEPEDLADLSKSLRVPVVIVGLEEALYSFAEALVKAIETKKWDGATGWLVILPPIRTISDDIKLKYIEYQASLKALVAA